MGERSLSCQLEAGRLGERLVSSFFQRKGYGVLPSYEFSGANGDKAPRLMFSNDAVVIPDLDLCKEGKRFWCEVKTYHGPATNRRHDCEVHGITRRLRQHYERCERETGVKVSIVILEVWSAELLHARLGELTDWPCQCYGCSSGECTAPIKSGTYWPRDEMNLIHIFDEEEMVTIRSKWKG